MKKKTILYIDSENLKFYIKKVFRQSKIKNEIEDIDFNFLFDSVLKDVKIDKKRFYSAKLHFSKNSPKKSKDLIQKQRALKAKLENSEFDFIIGGNVRGQVIKVDGKTKTIFREKGVDVRIAVDIVKETCENKINRIILCSSDSDLQPAVYEAKKKNVEIIYLGFELNPNKGLIYTTNRTILLRNSEILAALKN
ncbi:MAG: NYN domain-containing protein [Patescibacteria group bacterium]